ncbi:MAG: rhomboid family intramembrane serine protease [Actinobacteria bacterium]|nr:rhomboid family intramembrane serine protease [Actinomycetota bacterium]
MATCYRHPDRETGLSCSECGRPICTECMTMAPVGIRCPDHAGNRPRRAMGPRPVVQAQRRVGAARAPVTMALIGINVAVYLVTAVQGHGLNSPGGSLFFKWALDGPDVANGGWWRLITAAFLHEGILHIGLNMLSLFFIGPAVEQYLGARRFLAIYLVAGLAGSAGALLQAPLTYTVGASGAIFGILGAYAVLEWQATGRIAGQAMTWIVINLVFSFTVSGISWGGHVGGLIAGVLGTLSFARWGRGHAAYGRIGVVGALGIVAIAAGSVAIAYFKVRGYA